MAGGDTPNTAAITSQIVRELGSRASSTMGLDQQKRLAQSIDQVLDEFVGNPQEKYYEQKVQMAKQLVKELEALGFTINPSTGTLMPPAAKQQSSGWLPKWLGGK